MPSSTLATWSKLASSSRLQRSSQSLSVLGSQVWIFGGELQPREPVDNQLDVIQVAPGLDNAAAQTIPAPSYAPTPRVGSAMVALGDAFYLFSGRGGLAMMPVEEKGALWRYVPAISEWSQIKPADAASFFPEGRSYNAIASDGVENIYIHAGCPEKGRLADLWVFNVASRNWAKLPDAPAPGRGGSSVAFTNGKLYRINGFDGSKELGGAIDVFDPATSTWSTIMYNADGSEAPEPRSVGALLAVRVHGKQCLALLFGERDPSSLGHAGAGKMLSDVWLFDLQNQQWTKVEASGPSPAPRGWFDADTVRLDNERDGIIVHGGLAEDNSRLGDVWMLNID